MYSCGQALSADSLRDVIDQFKDIYVRKNRRRFPGRSDGTIVYGDRSRLPLLE